ncbi:MAG: DUF4350 domain-containing protein [Candidatus Dadabacteria bacterium]
MKRALPYIVTIIFIIILAALIVGSIKKPQKRLDERITLRAKDKIPYGFSAAKTLLPKLFLHTAVHYEASRPGSWNTIDEHDSGQAVILVANYLDANERELARMLEFVKRGNFLFIISRAYSFETSQVFRFRDDPVSYEFSNNDTSDSLLVELNKKYFLTDSSFSYPGKKFESVFSTMDTAHTTVLGTGDEGLPNFIQFHLGRGSIFMHSAPLCFSNYFILHKKNLAYYENAFSVLPQDVKSITWNEYFLQKKRNRGDQEPNWLGIMLKYPSFRWGFYTAIILLGLFLLLGMRRKQRLVPAYVKPKNESLDFVRTIGMLYYDQKDHRNLAEKMSIYFLDHVRRVYKLPTEDLDDPELAESLHFKSGYPLHELQNILAFIKNINSATITEAHLSTFYKQLELFYQNT